MSGSDRTSMPTDLHRQCWLMLPWIVTGRIAASDKQPFERHLLACAECRDELERQRALCERIRRDEPVMLAPQSSLQKLMARIDASAPEQDESSTAPAPPAPVRSEKRTAPRWLAIAAAIQALAIVGLLTLVWQQRAAEMDAPRFTTLSAATPPQPSGTLLRIVFSSQMTNAELQQLLRRVGASVVDGPTEAGVYSVRLAQGGSAQEISAVLTKVRASPHVVFAEHVSTEAPR